MTNPYGVDSRILEQSILSPRSESRAGIGFGSPRAFPFKAGALGSDWSLNAGPWSVVPYEGFLRFQGNIPGVTGGGNRAKATIARPFSLNQTSVTVAFSLRFNQVSIADSSGGFLFEFAPGLVLDWGNEGTNASYVYTDSDSSLVHLAPSTIKADGKWHRIVVSIQQGTVMLWEDDQLVLTWAPVPSLEDVVQASFGVSTNGVTASVDVGDVTVLVGTTQRARLRIADSDQSAFRTRLPYLQGLASSVPSVREAALSISNSLRNIEIGPSAFFWGLDISPSIQQLAKSLQSDQRVSRLMTSATQGAGVPTGSSPTIYLGVGVTVSYYISGGVSIGLYMGSGQNGYTVAALTASGGLVTNVGVQDAFEFGISWLKPDDLMGLGQYMQIDGGEFIQGSIGAAGNAPLDMAHFSNCGPALSLGIGLSSSPVDLAAGLSYTWSMAKF